MGKLWRTCHGRNPGTRKSDGSAGYEEGEEGVRAETKPATHA